MISFQNSRQGRARTFYLSLMRGMLYRMSYLAKRQTLGSEKTLSGMPTNAITGVGFYRQPDPVSAPKNVWEASSTSPTRWF